MQGATCIIAKKISNTLVSKSVFTDIPQLKD